MLGWDGWEKSFHTWYHESPSLACHRNACFFCLIMSKVNQAWYKLKWRGQILISNTVIGRKVQCELCSASVLQRWLGSLNSEGLGRDVKHYKTQERALVHGKSIWIFKLGLIQVLLSHRGCRRGPIFRCWLRGTVNSSGRLEFSQANTSSRRAWVILGMWPWTIRNC